MDINNFKDLQKLLKLCRSEGVRSISIDNIQLELSEIVPQKTKKGKLIQDPTQYDLTNIDESIQIPQLNIPTDELTEEQLLMWSASKE